MSDPMKILTRTVEDAHGISGGAQAQIARDLEVSEAFVSKCVLRGWFPADRARALAAQYKVPVRTLVKPSLRTLFDA